MTPCLPLFRDGSPLTSGPAGIQASSPSLPSLCPTLIFGSHDATSQSLCAYFGSVLHLESILITSHELLHLWSHSLFLHLLLSERTVQILTTHVVPIVLHCFIINLKILGMTFGAQSAQHLCTIPSRSWVLTFFASLMPVLVPP